MRHKPQSARVAGPQGRWLWPLGLGMLGACLIWLFTTPHGIGLSADSAAYLSAAESLLHGQGYLRYDGRPLAAYPPLYSTMLAAVGAAGFSMLQAARVLNAIAFGVLIVLSDALFRQHLERERWIRLGAPAALASVQLVGVSVMAWSEVCFTVLTVAFALVLGRHRHRTPCLPLLIALGAATCLQRYVGLAGVVAGGLLVGASNPGIPRAHRLRRGLVFVSLAALPLVLWMGRNRWMTGALTGPFPSGRRPVLQSLLLTLEGFGAWVLPLSGTSGRIVGLGVLALLLSPAFVWIRPGGRAILRRRGPQALVPRAFVLAYGAFLLLSSTRVWVEISERIMAPMTVFGCVILVGALEQASERGWRESAGAWRWGRVGFGICVVWLLVGFGRVTARGVRAMEQGAGDYNQAAWRQSSLLHVLRTAFPPGPLYSNIPDVIYLLTGQRAQWTPRHHPPLSAAQVREALPGGRGAYAVWSTTWERRYLLYQLPELRAVVDMEPVLDVEDGRILRIP